MKELATTDRKLADLATKQYGIVASRQLGVEITFIPAARPMVNVKPD